MNQKIMAIIIVVVIAVVAISAYALLSQQAEDKVGALTVRWEDINGAKIGGVTLTIMGAQETVRSAVTNSNGEVTFTDLPEGDYEGIAAKEGYQTIFITAKITSGRTTTLNSGINPEQQGQIEASITPMATTIKQGNTAAVTINALSTDDTSGTFSLTYVDFYDGTNTLPTGISATFNPESITLSAGGQASSILTFSASTSAPTGIYKIGITISYQNGGNLAYGWLLLQVI